MPDEYDTAWPPSSPPRTSSKASQVSVASVRLYRRSVPSTKFDAGTSGVFRGAPGTRSGRPPTMAQVSGFIGCRSVVLSRDQPGCPKLPGGRARPGGNRVVLVHEGLQVRLGEVVVLVVRVVAEVVAALAALARLRVILELRPGEQFRVRLGDQPQSLVQCIAVRHAQPCE